MSNITYPIIQFLLTTGTLEFSRAQILSAELVEETAALSTELSINTLTFKIKTDNFSMFDDLVLEYRTPILAYEMVNEDRKLLGKFYLDTWKNLSEQVTEFNAFDIIGVLNSSDFDGAYYDDEAEIPAVLDELLLPLNITYYLDPYYTYMTVLGWIPPGNARDALVQICFALNASVVTARSEILRIVRTQLPERTYDHRIFPFQKLNGSSMVEKLSLISYIEVVAHNYSQKATYETFFDKYLEIGTYKIVFDQPYVNISITGPGYVPFTLGTEDELEITTEDDATLEAGGEFNISSNAVYLNITTPGQVTITGLPFLDSKRSFTYYDASAQNKNSIVISDATLVNSGNGNSVLEFLKAYYQLRYIQKIKILPSDVEVGDIIYSSAIHGVSILSYVLKSSIDLCNGFMAKLETRGYIPVFVPPAETPIRMARSGVSTTNADLTRNNGWRQYE